MYGDAAAVLAGVLEGAPPGRPAGTWPSAVTSADVKLAYDDREDRFVAFVVGDVNASPEGIALVHEERTPGGGVVEAALDAYLSNLDAGARVAATLSPAAFDAETGWRGDGWLTRDRRALVEALADREDVAAVDPSSSGDLRLRDGVLRLGRTGRPYDGYVNLDDTGSALLSAFDGNLAAMSAGANAPTAVWTPELPATGKDQLLADVGTLAGEVGAVRVPRHRRVRSLGELEAFRKVVGGAVVLKGPFGTHGDEVVTVGPGEDAAARIDEETRRVQSLRDWPAFSMRDGRRLRFRHPDRAPVGYAVVEAGIEGRHGEDGRFRVLDYRRDGRRCPIDLVPLAVRAGDGAAVPSVLVRASSRTDLNANTSAGYTTFESFERCFEGPIPVDHPEDDVRLDLRAALSRVADRPVELPELRPVLERAGTVALAARNRSALRAERSLSGG